MRGEASTIVPVHGVRSADLTDGGNDFRADPFAVAHLVPRNVSPDAEQRGGSSIELGRRLGVTQTTAWKLKHKLMQVMMERDAGKRLGGRIEIDDA